MDDIRDGNCPLCRHHEIIESIPLIPLHPGVRGPLAVAEDRSKWMDARTTRGDFHSFTCRACGFTQWFALDAASIPIGEGHPTRLVTGIKSTQPFR